MENGRQYSKFQLNTQHTGKSILYTNLQERKNDSKDVEVNFGMFISSYHLQNSHAGSREYGRFLHKQNYVHTILTYI